MNYAEIGNLTNLTRLDLSWNELIGNIPAEIGKLTNLTWLDLFSNQLSGNIPAEIGNLTYLTCLSLSNNQLSGNIPTEICQLTYLTCLSLSINQLNGNIPTEIGNLTNLEILNLSSNQLNGNIPTVIGNLINLTSLDLQDNQLTGNIPVEIGNLTNLSTLTLYDNQLSGNIPSEIGNLSNLIWLSLRNNQLTGVIPVEIGKLTKLNTLFLTDNQLTGNIPSEIGLLTNLAWLVLSYNKLSGNIPPEIGLLTNLEILELNHNQLINDIPVEIGKLTKLNSIDLSKNNLSGEIPSTLYEMNTTSIDIRYNWFTYTETDKVKDKTNWQNTPQDFPGELVLVEKNDSLFIQANVINIVELNGFKWNNNTVTNNPLLLVQESGNLYCETTYKSHPNNILRSNTLAIPKSDIEKYSIADSLALVALYNSTDGENWKTKTNWLSGPLATWYGISLYNDRVNSISLKSNNLRGMLNKELCNLTRLARIDFTSNYLKGPVTLKKPNSLKTLDITYNYFNTKDITDFINLNKGISISYNPQNTFNAPEIKSIDNQLFLTIPDSVYSENDKIEWYFNNYLYSDYKDTFPLLFSGKYKYQITNSSLSGFTIKSFEKTVKASDVAHLLQNDSLALVNLYNNTDGPDWKKSDNWLSGQLKDWYGITIEKGRVNSIILENNNLSGTFPDITPFYGIVSEISFEKNKLYGPIPAGYNDRFLLIVNENNLIFKDFDNLNSTSKGNFNLFFGYNQNLVNKPEIIIKDNKIHLRLKDAPFSTKDEYSWRLKDHSGMSFISNSPEPIVNQKGNYYCEIISSDYPDVSLISQVVEVPDSLVKAVMAVKDNEQPNSNLIIYPNPTSGKFAIESQLLNATNCILNIYNTAGLKVFGNKPITNSTNLMEIDLQNFSDGIYLIELISNSHVEHKYLIMKK